MVGIKIRENESIEEALKRFKRECDRHGLMLEMKRREHYESPSVKRKRKAQEARRKFKKKYPRFR
ncbi:MAG: 30S ribosomal protein S21 [Elusimicrobia bacterium]|nr:30S ribosomal protein S21 [Elusimicrobiota bacterium]OGR79659.1 MAG: 30S ribosomal protein S21 [Elusimicrobia bacterium RIFCSPHIGHO2_02_FULL_39_36]OGR92986.1 MAG: 30S ribosomal protein S21 [Elusimicrobia bacterium RIFCSPLOWO2_02_FULL_39_32]OGR99769.1 MAG: 30S ribosomal protein S21 [Elusimicrobia bacterium RIFCSPLOWO2_12_FULL_39_28]